MAKTKTSSKTPRPKVKVKPKAKAASQPRRKVQPKAQRNDPLANAVSAAANMNTTFLSGDAFAACVSTDGKKQLCAKEAYEIKQLSQSLWLEPAKFGGAVLGTLIVLFGIIANENLSRNQRNYEFEIQQYQRTLDRMTTLAGDISRMVSETKMFTNHTDSESKYFPQALENLKGKLASLSASSNLETGLMVSELLEHVNTVRANDLSETTKENLRRMQESPDQEFRLDELRRRLEACTGSDVDSEINKIAKQANVARSNKKLQLQIEIGRVIDSLGSLKENFEEINTAKNWEKGLRLKSEWETMKTMQVGEIQRLFSGCLDDVASLAEFSILGLEGVLNDPSNTGLDLSELTLKSQLLIEKLTKKIEEYRVNGRPEMSSSLFSFLPSIHGKRDA